MNERILTVHLFKGTDGRLEYREGLSSINGFLQTLIRKRVVLVSVVCNNSFVLTRNTDPDVSLLSLKVIAFVHFVTSLCYFRSSLFLFHKLV